MASPRRGLDGISDDDIDNESGAKKLKTNPDVVMVDITTLRSLLQEQAAGIVQQQQGQRDSVAKRMEDKQTAMFRTLHTRIDATSDKVEALESQMAEFKERLDKLETAKASAQPTSAAQVNGDRKTLIFGGWPRNSRRGVILEDLGKALAELKVDSQLDDSPFCTGARRSIGMANFWPRNGEGPDQLKKRMFKIISVFNEKYPMNSFGKKIWVSFKFSKPQQERLRGAHAAWARRVLQELKIDLTYAALDVECATASAWLGNSKIAGMDKVEGKLVCLLMSGRLTVPGLTLKPLPRRSVLVGLRSRWRCREHSADLTAKPKSCKAWKWDLGILEVPV